MTITSFSPVGLKTFSRFSGVLQGTAYEIDFTGFELITDTDDELTDCRGMFDVEGL